MHRKDVGHAPQGRGPYTARIRARTCTSRTWDMHLKDVGNTPQGQGHAPPCLDDRHHL